MIDVTDEGSTAKRHPHDGRYTARAASRHHVIRWESRRLRRSRAGGHPLVTTRRWTTTVPLRESAVPSQASPVVCAMTIERSPGGTTFVMRT